MFVSRVIANRLISCSVRKCIPIASCSSLAKTDEPLITDKKAARIAERKAIKAAMEERKKRIEELDEFSQELVKQSVNLPDDDELRPILGSSLIRDPLNKKSIDQMEDGNDRTGKPINQFRKIVYEEGELDNSDLTKPASRSNPHPFDPSTLPPTHARSLMAYVNHLPVLQRLVDIGVDLYELDLKPKLGQKLLHLDLMNDVKPRVAFLAREVGIDLEDVGPYLNRNPYFLFQPMEDLQARIKYLRDKKFTKEQIRKIVIAHRYWLNMDVKNVDSRLGWLQKQFQLSGNALRELLTKEPRIIIFGTGPIKRLLFLFNNDLEFEPFEIKKMLIEDPRLFLLEPEQIKKTHRYLSEMMKIGNELIANYPLILRCPIADIRKRNEFLKRLNMDQYQPELPNYISLKKLVHPSDRYFSETVCRKFLHDYDNFLKTL